MRSIENVIAIAAGVTDGLGLGANTKAAVIRIGLSEMQRICAVLSHEPVRMDTFFESCGVADLITTCFGGEIDEWERPWPELANQLMYSKQSC